jgi:hypothetical protein
MADQNAIELEQSVQDIRENLLDVNSSFDKLNIKVEETVNENKKFIKESQELLHAVNVSVNSQNNNQIKFVEILNEVKKIKEKSTDLEFSIATDAPYVISVILSILASVVITWLLLNKDANIGHKRLIKEFRQKWVNDFRDTTTLYIDLINQIQTFQQNNISFYITRNSLIEIKNDFNENKNDINALDVDLREKVKRKLKATREFEAELKAEHSTEYIAKNSEYLELLSKVKVLDSKLSLLLKPEFTEKDVKDKDVFDAMTALRAYVDSPSTRNGIMNHETLIHYSDNLLKSTQKLLKSEWDRIRNSASD